jgi:hypothetical protein
MRIRTIGLALAIAALAAASCARPNPTVRVSSERIPRHWMLEVQGAGFTPQRNISSHLRRPDGTEYPVLPIATDGRGEFTHTIDTMILNLGAYELWVIDDASGKTSNRVRFEVTYDYGPS